MPNAVAAITGRRVAAAEVGEELGAAEALEVEEVAAGVGAEEAL
jgi:hypothetical protein